MYMLVNKLNINLGKCCYMKFKPISNTETNLEDRLIKIGETPIKQVSETKFLGIIIDDKLTWNPQIQEKNNNSRKNNNFYFTEYII